MEGSDFRKQKIIDCEGSGDELELYLRESMIERERNIDKIEELTISRLREAYDEILEVLELYIDMPKNYYPLVATWIIGTYFHKDFNAYPYLFFNAMRGSGKTRTIKLITSMAKEGQLMASPTEAVLFRMTGTLGIDEFENIGSKEKSAIRELLNASYKKGIKIYRMKKKKSLAGEELVPEEFEPYRPIVMANIWGMEEVLGDRCITLILEKSNDNIKTRLIEDFENNENIKNIKKTLSQCSLCNVVSLKNIYRDWNNYVINRYKYTYNTYNTYDTLNTQTEQLNLKLDKLFNKIIDSGIYGRNLELFIPIFFIGELIGSDILVSLLNTAKDIVSEKTHEEEMESKDVQVLDFISKTDYGVNYASVKELTRMFKDYIDDDEDFVNAKWFGRALKRLNLVVDKRRVSQGIEVVLNIPKALEKFKNYKIGKKC